MTSPLRFRAIVIGTTAALALALWWGAFRTVQTIETAPVYRGDIENAVTALGTLQPLRYVDVGVQVSGQIKRIAVRPGDIVAEGDLLVEIDPAVQEALVRTNRATLASLRAQLAEQEAVRDLARRQSERQRRMAADGATRAEDVDTAQANLSMAEARLVNLRAQIEGAQSTLDGNETLLGYTRIYAPIAGTVVTLDAREGQTLNATYQTPNLLRIADLSRMTVWTEVSEADVGRIRPGMAVYFTTLGLMAADGTSRRWTGTLRQVLPAPPTPQGAASSSSGGAATASSVGKVVSYTALFDVDNGDGALLPQMSAQVFFVAAAARNVPMVPLAALKAKAGDDFSAKVLTEGLVEERAVRLGVRDRLNGEILSGLIEGELVITAITHVQASRRLRW